MFQPARLNSAMVESCRLPLGMPSRSLFAMSGLRGLVELDRAGETTHGSLVAHQAVAFHFHAKQQRVVIAIGGGGDDAQAVAAGFALHPELLAGAAPEGDEACFESAGVAGGIEKAQHQHLAGAGILDDAGGESIHLVEVDHVLWPWLEFVVRSKKPAGWVAGGL